MKLQTQIPVTPKNNRIDYNSRLLLLGSCFVENMGRKLDYFKFPCLQNPFGILFHPGALENFTARVAARKQYTEEAVFEHNGQWHCFDAHSVMSDNSREVVLSRLNKAINLTTDFLENATHIVITLGTAWEYRLKDSGCLVANCHKVPQRQFTKELAPVEAIEKSIGNIIEHIRSVNPGVQFIFTVSPVRHLKDGFVENQRSKAHLITALHSVLNPGPTPGPSPIGRGAIKPFKKTKEEGGDYFPSYEIMMDELRDYRFYAEDMIHPSQTAIDYIWEKFAETWISPKAFPVMEEVNTIQKGLAHKPFAPDSDQHRKFLKKLAERISDVQAKIPHIRF